MPPSKNISFEELSKYFHLPINQVAKELGVCATILKKICRRNGIPRWPHRKMKSLDKMISNLEVNLQKNPLEREDISREIDMLKIKKNEILTNPDVLAKVSPIDLAKSAKIVKAKQNVSKAFPSLKTLDGKPVSPSEEINCFLPNTSTSPSFTTTASCGGASSVNSRPSTTSQKNAFSVLLEIASEPQVQEISKKPDVLFVPQFNMPMTTFTQRPIHSASSPSIDSSVELPAFRLKEEIPSKPVLPVLEPHSFAMLPPLNSQLVANVQWSLPSIQYPDWFETERKKFQCEQ